MKKGTKIRNYIIAAFIVAQLALVFGIQSRAENPLELTPLAQLKTAQGPAVKTAPSGVVKANPLEIVANPSQYLNKKVEIKGTFDKFSTLGLDYSRAMRSSQDYIGFLIQRPDVLDHDIPLSELKLFLKRDYAEKFIELDTGDKLLLEGTVFSTAMGDPWVDINKITIQQKIKKEAAKETK